MASVIMFIDHQHAKIFWMLPEGTKMEHLKDEDHFHHSRADVDKKKEAEGLYHKAAGAMKNASEILVIGPGVAKEQFVHHLEKHKHADISKKIVGVESCDHPSDNQILAFARKFFKLEHLFNA